MTDFEYDPEPAERSAETSGSATATADPDRRPEADSETQDQPKEGLWRYVGDVERVYVDVPVTVAHGDVLRYAGPPADDGCWEEVGDDAHGDVVLPDNHPDRACNMSESWYGDGDRSDHWWDQRAADTQFAADSDSTSGR